MVLTTIDLFWSGICVESPGLYILEFSTSTHEFMNQSFAGLVDLAIVSKTLSTAIIASGLHWKIL